MVQHRPMNLVILYEKRSPNFESELRLFFQKTPFEIHFCDLNPSSLQNLNLSDETWTLLVDHTVNPTYADYLRVCLELLTADELTTFVVGDRFLQKNGTRAPPSKLHWLEALIFEKLKRSLSQELDYFSPLVAVRLSEVPQFKTANSFVALWGAQALQRTSTQKLMKVVPIGAKPKSSKPSIKEIIYGLFLPARES